MKNKCQVSAGWLGIWLEGVVAPDPRETEWEGRCSLSSHAPKDNTASDTPATQALHTQSTLCGHTSLDAQITRRRPRGWTFTACPTHGPTHVHTHARTRQRNNAAVDPFAMASMEVLSGTETAVDGRPAILGLDALALQHVLAAAEPRGGLRRSCRLLRDLHDGWLEELRVRDVRPSSDSRAAPASPPETFARLVRQGRRDSASSWRKA